MLTREIRLDTEGAPVTLNPRWLRIPAAVKYSGLSRSRLYELLSEGSIRSICVKSQKWAQRGVRLIDRESIDLFMERQESAVTDALQKGVNSYHGQGKAHAPRLSGDVFQKESVLSPGPKRRLAYFSGVPRIWPLLLRRKSSGIISEPRSRQLAALRADA